MLGIPYLIDTRDLYPATYVLGGLISREGYFYAALCRVTRYLYAGAFHNFSATKGLAIELYDSFDLPAFPDVVMNGYPAALCDEITSKSPSLCRDVIMHGTFGRMQNVSLLLDVVMKMPDTTFTFIGEGVMFQQVREAKLDNVVVYSRLPHEEVLRIVAQHKVGLSFRSGSWYDGMSLPVKIFEFLGLGLSVVSYPRTEFDDDQYARTRITNIDSPVADDIAQALSQALSDVRGCGNFNDSQHLSREYQSKVFSDVIVDRLSSPYGKADVS